MPGAALRQLVRQLPFIASDFTGRSAESEQITRWLSSGSMPRIVNIFGIPGSGKSTLAIRLGQMISNVYPDCQLYFNLRESQNQQPVPPDDLLASALLALGAVATEMPSGLFLRASAFRSAVAGLRSIIVIDNASDAFQVEPLLPGSSDSAVLITSWAPISELPGIHTINLEPFGESDAIDMLLAVTGRDIADSDLPVVHEIVKMVGGLPLALRIAGGLLKPRNSWSWQDLLDRLSERDSSASLDALKAGTLSVRETLRLAYRDLDGEVALGYRLLGLAPTASMNVGLARLLVSAGSTRADGILDELLVRGLLHLENSSTVRMHDLVWINAHELVAKADDLSVRTTAVDKMIAWSLNQLDMQYLPKLRLALRLLPPTSDDRSALLLSQMFVDGGIVTYGDGGEPESLASVFPVRQQRLLLVAPGGTGKTTLVNQLCDQAAISREQDHQTPVPLMLLMRDLRPEDPNAGLEQVLLRLLHYRYDVDLPPEALQVALERGLVFLVLDGLDEVIDERMRSDIFAAISNFGSCYDQVSILITTRPHPGLDVDLPDFKVANVAQWPQSLIENYLLKLGAATRNPRYSDNIEELSRWVRTSPVSDAISTPLGLQLAATLFDRVGHIPRSFNTLVAEIIQRTIFRREEQRGTLYVNPNDLLRALQVVAYTMQSDLSNRTLITLHALIALLVAHQDIWDSSDVSLAELVEAITFRAAIFQELGITPEGETFYGFTHTAFREHLAAAYLAQCSPEQFVTIISKHLSDASWEAVIVAALEPGRHSRDESFQGAVEHIASKRSDPALTNALRIWSDEATRSTRGQTGG